MERYRGVSQIITSDNQTLKEEAVVKADSFKEAIEKLIRIRRGLQRDNVISFNISVTKDELALPDREFIRRLLLLINDRTKFASEREKAKNEIYSLFRAYQPLWDDDTLADALSYAEEGELLSYGDIDKIVDDLLEELDGEWE